MAIQAARAASGAAPAAPALEAAYLRCEAIARSHYENFPVVSRFMNKEIRRSLAPVYAFARGADDLADEGYGPGGPTPEARLAALDDWEARLGAACGLRPAEVMDWRRGSGQGGGGKTVDVQQAEVAAVNTRAIAADRKSVV